MNHLTVSMLRTAVKDLGVATENSALTPWIAGRAKSAMETSVANISQIFNLKRLRGWMERRRIGNLRATSVKRKEDENGIWMQLTLFARRLIQFQTPIPQLMVADTKKEIGIWRTHKR